MSNLSDLMPKPYSGLSIPVGTDNLLFSRNRPSVIVDAVDTTSGAEVYPQILLRTYRQLAGAGGLIAWLGENLTPVLYTMAKIIGTITTRTAGAEGGKLDFQVSVGGAMKSMALSGDDAALIPGASADFGLGIAGKRFGSLYMGGATVKGDLIVNGATLEFGANSNHPLNFKTNNVVRGGFDALGNFAHKAALADQSYSKQVPTTGFSITVGNGVGSLLLDPAGTLATGTITTPAAPVDGHILRLATTQTITALTLAANAGQTVSGAVSTLTAAAPATYQYVLSLTKWFHIS